MNTFKITFADGNTITTGMNATLEEATAYYIGNKFQFGDTDAKPFDYLVEAVSIEQLAKLVYCKMCEPYKRELSPGFIHNAHQTIPCFNCNATGRQWR